MVWSSQKIGLGEGGVPIEAKGFLVCGAGLPHWGCRVTGPRV